MPHEVFNRSDTEPVVAIVARSDASEWANIVPYDRETETVKWAEADGEAARNAAARAKGSREDADRPPSASGS